MDKKILLRKLVLENTENMSLIKDMMRWRGESTESFFTDPNLELDTYKEWLCSRLIDPTIQLFVREVGEIRVGLIGLSKLDQEKRTAEFGPIMIDKNHQRKGYTETGQREFLEYCFNKISLTRTLFISACSAMPSTW